MKKDKERLEEHNGAFATMNQVAMFPLHVSDGVNLATSSYGGRDQCTGQSNFCCVRSDKARPRWSCDRYAPTEALSPKVSRVTELVRVRTCGQSPVCRWNSSSEGCILKLVI
jgi:hypothetical protein